MLHSLAHILKALWAERVALFWPIWFAITAIGVILVIWLIPQRKSVSPDSVQAPRQRWSRAAVLAVAFLSLFLACYIAGCLVWEDFAYSDNSIFTLYSLAGHAYPPPIWPAEGRFFPLSHQEFNLLGHVTHSVMGYHAFRIVELLLLCGLLLVLDDQLRIQARVALILLLLVTPSFLISFSGLIYSEANVLLLLAFLIWFVKKFEQTQSAIWAAAGMIAAQFMLYYKETAFVLLLSFAVGRLFLRCKNAESPGWDFKRLREPESRLDLCLIFLVAMFLLYYFAAMFPTYSTGYADLNRLTLPRVIAAYLRLDLLVWVLTAVVLARIVLILRGKLAPMLLWDGLALAGIGCFAGYLILHMESAYYLAPVDLIAVLYVGRLTILSIPKMNFATKSCAVALLVLVLLQDLSLSAFRMYERKNTIHAKAEIGRVIKERFKNDPQNTKRLFLPFANTHRVKEFGAYLNYLGVPVEGIPSDSLTTNSVVFIVRMAQQDGPCEGPGTPVCRPGSRPDSGDLVLLLPDDFTRTDGSNSYQQEGDEVFLSYQPFPSIPGWLRPYTKCLHVVSPVFPHALPDHWLNASVSVWK